MAISPGETPPHFKLSHYPSFPKVVIVGENASEEITKLLALASEIAEPLSHDLATVSPNWGRIAFRAVGDDLFWRYADTEGAIRADLLRSARAGDRKAKQNPQLGSALLKPVMVIGLILGMSLPACGAQDSVTSGAPTTTSALTVDGSSGRTGSFSWTLDVRQDHLNDRLCAALRGSSPGVAQIDTHLLKAEHICLPRSAIEEDVVEVMVQTNIPSIETSYFVGFVAEDIALLKAIFADGSVEEVPTFQQAWGYSYLTDRRPSRLEGYDADGQRLISYTPP
jgi:hypothetical protein